MRHIIVAIVSLLLPALGADAAEDAATQPNAAPTVLVVVGAEGSPEYGPEFAKWADRWASAASAGSARFVAVGRDAENEKGPTDRDRLKSAIEAEVGVAPATSQSATAPSTLPSDARPLWLVLIGHGTFDGREAKFNLRGPDVSDQELAGWLRPCRRPLAVINCASGSAPFLNRLSGPGRVVVVATRSGQEMQYARFGDFMSAALTDPAADADKDGQTSLLEAFLAASKGTEAFYKQAGRLATEHALLDDTGDALGTPATFFAGTRATRSAKDGSPVDGRRAHQWHLVPSPAERAMPPAARVRRDELELKVQTLRDRKPVMSEPAYYAELEGLLVELAKVYQPDPANGGRSKVLTPPTSSPGGTYEPASKPK